MGCWITCAVVVCLLDEDRLGDRTSSTTRPRHKSLHRETRALGWERRRCGLSCLSACRDTHGVLGEGVLGCMGQHDSMLSRRNMSLSLYVCPYCQLAACKFSHGLALLSDEGLELSHVSARTTFVSVVSPGGVVAMMLTSAQHQDDGFVINTYVRFVCM